MNVIISVLSYANKCMLFNQNIDTEKTIFNHYLLELIPLLNKFYAKLIDIELPQSLNDLIENTKLSINININNNENNYINNNKDLLEEKKHKEPVYNYFSGHSDELLHLQCICFCVEDILAILSLIGKNIQAFSGLSQFDMFQKTYDFIIQNETLVNYAKKKEKDKKQFFLIFKTEKNKKYEKILKHNKTSISSFTSEDQDSDLITKRFKFCIKTILKGLNLLNNKDYPYLNMATTNRKFFSALKYILDDFGELSETKKKIPLKWYGQYIFNNIDALEQAYKKDDYLNLYKEIYEEERQLLNELKSMSSTIITRDGMNIRCAEKILQKEKYDNFHINQAKEFVKIDRFVEEEKIEVCIKIFGKEELNNIREKEKEKNKRGSARINKNIVPIMITEDVNCSHRPPSKSNELDGKVNKNKIPYHAYTIKDFINKFSENPWEGEKSSKDIKPIDLVKEDIQNGKRDNQIYASLSYYMNIIKKHIRKDKDNFNIKSESDCSEIAGKIEDYIMRQIYNHVYPKKELQADIDFYNQTKRLYWILPEHLDIKKVYINQLSNAELWIKKIDESKSIRDKLLCIGGAYNTMNNTIKFSSGKNENAGQDELTPIFQYIIIKAQPKRIFSNINFIKCFLTDIDLTGELGFLLTQMESSTSFIMNIDYQHLKITEEEFNKNIREAEEKMKSENIIN